MNHKKFMLLFVTSFVLMSLGDMVNAQQVPQRQKSAVELAAEQTERFNIALKLKDYQAFLMDSVLQANFVGVEEEVRRAQQSNIQSPEAMKIITERWALKTDSALIKFLDATQYERYLKLTKRDKRR